MFQESRELHRDLAVFIEQKNIHLRLVPLDKVPVKKRMNRHVGILPRDGVDEGHDLRLESSSHHSSEAV